MHVVPVCFTMPTPYNPVCPMVVKIQQIRYQAAELRLIRVQTWSGLKLQPFQALRRPRDCSYIPTAAVVGERREGHIFVWRANSAHCSNALRSAAAFTRKNSSRNPATMTNATAELQIHRNNLALSRWMKTSLALCCFTFVLHYY